MKLYEILENESLTVNRFAYYLGSRDTKLIKTVFDPFIKNVDKAMKALKGKWNGNNGYDFKKTEQYEEAKLLMVDYKAAWEQLLKDYPEGSVDYDSTQADAYFTHAKKYGARK